MRCCIQNAVNTMEMKDSRSGSRGPDNGGGGYGTGDRDHTCSAHVHPEKSPGAPTVHPATKMLPLAAR